MRVSGTPFNVRFLLLDPRAELARQLAPSLLQQFADYDARRDAFDALAAGTLKIGEIEQRSLSVYAPAVTATLRDVLKLSEAAVVRSTLEQERLWRHLGCRRPATFELPPRPEHIPACAGKSERVVIYGPELRREQLALLEFALEELRREVAVVYEGVDSAAALAGATVVVDASLDHAGNALALAGAGYTVVCATPVAAHEYLDGVIEYEPWNYRSVFAAVLNALGAPAPQLLAVELPVPERAVLVSDGPLVSIVVRTFNRPALLRRALESLVKQTYRNLEVVVVNDGGEDVGHIAAGPRIRYVALTENGGTSAAANAGVGAAEGTFIGFLDDDDVVFPEHVSALVTALLESSGDAAHADTIAAHFERRDDGTYAETGYVVFLDGLVEPTDFYVTDAIGPMSVLMRKDLILAAGGFDESLSHAEDWELYLKLSRTHDFIHVQKVTGMYSIRHDGSHMMSGAGEKVAASMERLMELHPLPHRPVMETARRQSLQKLREGGYAMRFPEPAMKRS